MRLLYLAGIVFSFACSAGVRAQGLSYADNRIFPHGYVDLDRAGPLAIPDYPFARIGRPFVFETSYRSLYDMKELADSRAGAACTIDRIQFGAAIGTFGEAGYFSQFGLAGYFACHWSDMSLGMSTVYSRIGFGGTYDHLSAVTFNMGGAYRIDQMTIFAVTRAVNQPRYYAGDEPIRPELEIGVSYKTDRGLDSQARALFEKYQKPTAELSQSFHLADYISINWSLVLLPARFGAGLALETGAFGFRYDLSHHTVLGMTHTVRLTISRR